ncbi:helix-turn-helix transcriptional regulator [Roseibium sediminicola]|uniref:HTH luxR-type domain-containing protein n=1 Tax=Roseibium sediminicola TaxID=2933272 RepID=A0ABT0GN87_9HYPH|nr:helix-turn-helix transcriptional regulator [Roseibium sp. CAU 1639]MCK7610882.1 hypothetical protein [Roseibium sp. CAU 1639]
MAFIDKALGCKSFLAEFDGDGKPLPHFGGQQSAQDLGTLLGRIETEGGRNVLEFLLSDASLHYPYCKTSLTRGVRETPTLNGSNGEPAGANGNLPDRQTILRQAPGLISPVWRADGSTILFGCLFTAHTPDTIDVGLASETFRGIVKALTPGLNIHFRIEKERQDSLCQRMLLSEVDGPAVLLSEDRTILAQTPGAADALARADAAAQERRKLLVKNKKLDAALLELAVATRQQTGGHPPVTESVPQRSFCISDANGFLKRLQIKAVVPVAEKPARPAEPMFIVRLSETSDVPEGVEKCLQDHFDLSQSEAHLARQLTLSGSMNATVDALGITRNTAKTHLRRIYEKTGVNTQLQLARLVHRLAQLF